jgi:hypothetical protein
MAGTMYWRQFSTVIPVPQDRHPSLCEEPPTCVMSSPAPDLHWDLQPMVQRDFIYPLTGKVLVQHAPKIMPNTLPS